MSLETALAENTATIKSLTDAIRRLVADPTAIEPKPVVPKPEAKAEPAPKPQPAPTPAPATEPAPVEEKPQAAPQQPKPEAYETDLKELRKMISERLKTLCGVNRDKGQEFLRRMGVRMLSELPDSKLVEAKITLDAIGS